jgi:raffinose/stachyose/melibiose transport system permease protein
VTAVTDVAARSGPAYRPSRPSRRRIDWGSPVTYAVALAVSAVAVGPIIYVILAGFRSNAQLVNDPAGLPSPWILDNYRFVLTSESFWSQVWQSSIVALLTTAGVVTLGVMAAFVLARYEFKGREALYVLFTAGLLFPLNVAILPLYGLLRDFGLLGDIWGLIIPQVAYGLPVTVVILRPFLRAIPADLEDAAAIDGSGKVGFFFRILLPLSGPGLVTVGVLAFVGSWNAFLLPLLVITSRDELLLPQGVQAFTTQYSQDTAQILAFTSLAMLPALLFFTLAERRIVSGLSGAVKG